MSLSDELSKLVEEHAQYDLERAAVMRAALGEQNQVSGYFLDLNRRALEQQRSIDAVRSEDLQLLADSRFPSSDCLTPREVLQVCNQAGELESARREHFGSCLYCQVLVTTSVHDKQREDDLVPLLAQSSRPHWPLRLWQIMAASLQLVRVAEPALAVAAAMMIVLLGVSPETRLTVSELLNGDSRHAERAATMIAASDDRQDSRPVVAYKPIIQFTAERDKLLLRAYMSAARRDADSTIHAADQVLAKFPPNTDALVLRGAARWQLGAFDSAQEDFAAAHKLDPSDKLPLQMVLMVYRSEAADLQQAALLQDLAKRLDLGSSFTFQSFADQSESAESKQDRQQALQQYLQLEAMTVPKGEATSERLSPTGARIHGE